MVKAIALFFTLFPCAIGGKVLNRRVISFTCNQAALIWGSDCGSVGRAVASNTRAPRFEAIHRQILLFFRQLNRKMKIKRKGPFMARFVNKVHVRTHDDKQSGVRYLCNATTKQLGVHRVTYIQANLYHLVYYIQASIFQKIIFMLLRWTVF